MTETSVCARVIFDCSRCDRMSVNDMFLRCFFLCMFSLSGHHSCKLRVLYRDSMSPVHKMCTLYQGLDPEKQGRLAKVGDSYSSLRLVGPPVLLLFFFRL